MRANRLLALCVVAAVLSIAFGATSVTQAELLNVQNASFESPTLIEGGANLGMPNWTLAMNNGGNFWPTAENYGDQLAGGDGTKVYAWIGELVDTYNAITQNLVALDGTTPVNYQAGTYKLNVLLAKRTDHLSNYNVNDTMKIGLFKASDDVFTATALASKSVLVSDLSNTSFNDYFATINLSSTDAAVGQQIKVAIMVNQENTAAALTADYVRLDFTAIPEPHSIVLLSTGLLGLLAYAWRQKR